MTTRTNLNKGELWGSVTIFESGTNLTIFSSAFRLVL